MNFSEKLKGLMAQNFESNYALAKAICVRPTTVSNWLNGKTSPLIRHIGRLSEHYGCDAKYFCDDEEEAK